MNGKMNIIDVDINLVKNWDKNPRTITPENFSKLKQKISRHGLFKPFIVYKDGEFYFTLGGNQRLKACKELGFADVKCVLVKPKNETEKLQIALADNEAAGRTDANLLAEILPDISIADISDYQVDAHDYVSALDILAVKPMDEQISKPQLFNPGVVQINDLAFFSASNEMEIPDILPDMLCSDFPTEIWNGQDKDLSKAKYLALEGTNKFIPELAGHFLGFYVDDKRFNKAWENKKAYAEDLLTQQWGGVLSPDFTLGIDAPKIIQIYNVYKSRWCARFWQELGIKIIPSLMPCVPDMYKYVIDTLPVGAPVMAMQLRTSDGVAQGQKVDVAFVKQVMTQLKPKNILFYGAKENKWIFDFLPKVPDVHFVKLDSFTKERSRFRQKKNDEILQRQNLNREE